MNLLHLFVKIFGGGYYDSETLTHYYYRGELNLFFIGKWIDLKMWCVQKYYAVVLWWLRRKIKRTADTEWFLKYFDENNNNHKSP